MCCFCKIFEIPWIKRVANKKGLDRINVKRQLYKKVEARRVKIIWHLLRHDSLK